MRCVLAIALITAPAVYGQAAAESAIITGATATGTAGGARGVGKGVGAIFEKATSQLKGAAKAGSSDASKPASSVTVLSTPKARSKGEPVLTAGLDRVPKQRSLEDVKDIKIGMVRHELVALGGKPALRVVQSNGNELLCFLLKAGGTVDVILTDGRVSEIKPVVPE